VIRAIKLSLSSLTGSKQVAVGALLREYRSAINFYCRSLWDERGKLDAATLKRYTGGCLGYRQKSDCLAMALDTVISTRKAAKALGKHWVSCPHVHGSVRVSELCAKIEKFEKLGFDYCLRLSGLIKGHPIVLPLKAHRQLLKWLAVPGAVLKDGCVLHENYVAVYVELPDLPVKEVGNDLGLDTGYRKLAVTSDGKIHGPEFSDVCVHVRRKRPGSKGKRKAQRFRAQYINTVVKSPPWKTTKTFVLEDLTGLKLRTQQKEKSSKKSRKTMAPWTYRQVLNRIEQLAPEHRVRLVFVDPRNTSRRCPCCGWVAKENRVKEDFCCVRCNYTADADFVGATNILARMTGNWQADMVPASSKSRGLSNVAV